MVAIDWLILSLYLGAMLGVSAWLSQRQRATSDYYLGGRQLPASAVGISTLATQSSAISFISIPAFVAVREHGGLRFLQYELALPCAMVGLAWLLLPKLHRAGVYTIYEYLEQRFDVGVRRAVSLMFLLGRGLATGVSLYATGLVLETCLGTPLLTNLLLLGAVTVLYDLMGGMAAVVYSDVVQMIVLCAALATCICVTTAHLGGPAVVWDSFPAERLATLDQPSGANDSLWSYVLGGLFLYASYYGCDQSQAQRLLSTPSVRAGQWAVLLNGMSRFPLILGYCALGVVAAAACALDPEFNGELRSGADDQLVPLIVRNYLPSGVRGLVFAGLLAAAMSSLDSALNALSASSVRDFGAVRLAGGSTTSEASSTAAELRRARIWTFIWGALITAFACVVGDISDTVIEAINKVGSAVYGPVLAVFILALARRPMPGQAVLWGLFTGVFSNILLWQLAPQVHFMWWNVSGCLCALLVSLLAAFGYRFEPPAANAHPQQAPLPADPRELPSPLPARTILLTMGGATAIMLTIMVGLQLLSQR